MSFVSNFVRFMGNNRNASTVDLTDDNNEDSKPPSRTVEAAAAADNNDDSKLPAERTEKPAAAAAPPAFIDLSDAPPSEFELQSAAYAASVQRSLSQQPQKRKCSHLSAAAVGDVIDLEEETRTARPSRGATSKHKTGDDDDRSYKQALGPIRMDFCTEFYPPHTFINTPQSPTLKTNKLFQELLEYKLNLPVYCSSSIFVRAMESRLDLLRVAVTGPMDTPYQHGVFFLDVHLHDYPAKAPRVQFLTTGGGRVRFNPNLYACGKVCLSLLGTWDGPGWISNQSTLLQVLVSIQGLVLVPEPFFNEPGFNMGQPGMMQRSESYNQDIRLKTLQYAVRDAIEGALGMQVALGGAGSRKRRKKNNQSQQHAMYPEFAEIVLRHFAHRADHVRAQVRSWTSNSGTMATAQLAQEIKERLDQVVASFNQTTK